MTSVPSAGVKWVFDPVPPSGALSGGNPAEYAFTPRIETFVREVIQNSKDAGTEGSSEPVKVNFRFISFRGDALKSFLGAVHWEELHAHLAVVAKQAKGAPLKRALQKLETDRQLLVLVVEDRNTQGLNGQEQGGESNFAALCRNTLDSKKADETSGGSYGLGKAVLWRFSAFSTVIFNSNLSAPLTGQDPPRLIGRSELPWHEVPGEGVFAGSGWLGAERKESIGSWTQSIWKHEAAALSKALKFDRDKKTGTSILIIGFRDPAEEVDQTPEELAQRVVRAAAIWFWPSITSRYPTLEVGVQVSDAETGKVTFQQDVKAHESVHSFIECAEAYESKAGKPELVSAGDVASVPIALSLPGTHDDQPPLVAEATLCVRLADEAVPDDDPHRNCVAAFRGSQMVIKYKKFDGLTLTARPFHAVLVCGKARIDGPTPQDEALDKFLRAAEPPEHNEWTTTSRLKDIYKQGYRNALLELDERVKEALRKLVSQSTAPGADGPQLLMNKFRFGRTGGGRPPGREPFEIEATANLRSDSVWECKGVISAKCNVHNGWEATVIATMPGEGGELDVSSYVKTLEVDSGAKAKIKDGAAEILVPANCRKVTFTLRTDPKLYPIDVKRGTFELIVKGRTK